MKTLKQYVENYIENCTNESLFDDEDVLSNTERDKLVVRKWIEENYIINGTLKINDDFTVDCVGGVMLENEKISSLANSMFRWGEIEGDFFCSCPKLKTLEGGPEWVSGQFNCYKSRNLKTLKGAPKSVGGNFVCDACNKLVSLEGAPEKVGGGFFCSNCKNLKSLEGGPKVTHGRFDCSCCSNLISLKGAPDVVYKGFICSECYNLETLEGAPRACRKICCKYCPKLKITDLDYKKYRIES